MALQLRAFAEQVLFATTLEDKLNFPREEMIDTQPRSAIKTPGQLSRPKELILRAEDQRVAAPRGSKLIDEKERGRLLHFFCNHELLATELMALVLLKFPDAPASFRQGILETLKEEQIHAKLYIHRMKQCGVEFGELPLSDYFWKSVSSMEDPLDYVTRLSLTFEQANLDYSREYAHQFQAAGDAATAAILDKIYRDEIGHVGFGLKWFRRWKTSGKSDWEAFRERLAFPLSPSRAKGNQFNREGRLEAGLENTFIDELQLFQQSRGRTPSVFWFNPDAEHFAARNSAADYPSESSLVQKDLEFLPAYLSRKDDMLVMEKQPGTEFLSQLQQTGIQLPEILVASGKASLKLDRKIGALRPWAWTPDSVRFFEDAFGSLTRPHKLDTIWNENRRHLFSKHWSAEWGRVFDVSAFADDWNASEEVYGKLATSIDEVERLRSEWQVNGYENVVCKAPFGTAAGGNRCLMRDDVLDCRMREWFESIIREQGEVIVEPWLERVYDFSIQFEMHEDQLKVLAFTRLVNNARGQFRGIICNGFGKDASDEAVRFLMQRSSGRPRIYDWYQRKLAPRLELAFKEIGFTGPLGVDAFVYRNRSGRLRLKSVVEINPRYTMGRVAHELSQRAVPGAFGLFQIVSRKQIKKSLGLSWEDYAKTFGVRDGISPQGMRSGRLSDVSIVLTDPKQAQRFLALFHIRSSMEEIQKLLSQF